MERLPGLVIKSTGSWYTVYDPQTGRTLAARLRGGFRLRGSRTTNPVAVGDRVVVELGTGGQGDNTIVELAERRNYLIRRASNLFF